MDRQTTTEKEGRTHNIGLLQCWQTNKSSSIYLCWALVQADRILLNICLKLQLFIYKLGFGSGRTSYESQHCSKPKRCSEIPATHMPTACHQGFRYIGRQLHEMYEALRDFVHLRFRVNSSLRSELREAAARCASCLTTHSKLKQLN